MFRAPALRSDRRTRLSKTGTVVAVVAGLLFGGAAVAAPASAEQNNGVHGYVNANGTWTPYTKDRHHTTPGNIWFQPSNLPSGGMCMELIWAVGGHSNSVCWWDHSAKYLAYNVLPNTTFRIAAHKRDASGTDNYWAGNLHY